MEAGGHIRELRLQKTTSCKPTREDRARIVRLELICQYIVEITVFLTLYFALGWSSIFTFLPLFVLTLRTVRCYSNFIQFMC